MRSDSIKVVIFDLGRVLIDFDHRIAAKKAAAFSDKDQEYIFNLFFDSDFTAEFEEGKISPKEFFVKVKKALCLNMDYDKFLPIWNEIFFLSPLNRNAYNIARSLKGRYKLALLTNVNILHFEYIRDNFDIFSIFGRIFTSFELGVQKPSPLIYGAVLKSLGVNPQEVFYTDDRPELVQSARSLGINGFIFKDDEQLKSDLASLNIFLEPGPALLAQ